MEERKFLKVLYLILDIFEIIIPSVMFFILLFSFLIGIVWRYVFSNPLSWTYELSSISFLYVIILAIPIAHRTNGHIVFDLFYNRLKGNAQCCFRLINNLMVAVFSFIMVPVSIRFVLNLSGLTMQIMEWVPRMVLFIPFPIMFASSAVRATVHFIMDICCAMGKGEGSLTYMLRRSMDDTCSKEAEQ